jgi:hypothetical protein
VHDREHESEEIGGSAVRKYAGPWLFVFSAAMDPHTAGFCDPQLADDRLPFQGSNQGRHASPDSAGVSPAKN